MSKDDAGATIGPICLGTSGLGGVFGNVIDDDAVIATLEACFSLGWTLIDTAPWYLASEEALGRTLQQLSYRREQYLIATKCGRYCDSERQFDYSEESVTGSVERSLRRLHTSYLDIVYVHDVEYRPIEETLHQALPALVKLKDRGVVRKIGICGYPLHILDAILSQTNCIQIVQTYCHGTLQNSSLLTFAKKWASRGVLIMNAAPLAMGLLTSSGPPEWHPAPCLLRERCKHVALLCEEKFNIPIQTLALQYSLNNIAKSDGLTNTSVDINVEEEHRERPSLITGTVIGCVSKEEVFEAQAALARGKLDPTIVECIRSALGEEWIDGEWSSGMNNK